MSLPANVWASACETSVSLRTGNGGLKPTLLAANLCYQIEIMMKKMTGWLRMHTGSSNRSAVNMQRFQGISGETLPSTRTPDWLRIEYVLQRYRDVWVPIEAYPFLAVNVERVTAHCASVDEFPVFASGRLMQNMRPDEGGSRVLSVLFGEGMDAGMSPDSNVIVEGIANPRAHWMMSFNDPFYIGMHPFAALGTHYVYIDSGGIYQRTFAELVIVDKFSRPRSTHVDFDPLADMVRTFHDEYINGPRDRPRPIRPLAALLNAIFVENEKILTAATAQHRTFVTLEIPFDYDAPTLTRYGRLTHDTGGLPRIELSFALLHYEKALHEFNEVKAATQAGNIETAFFHGVYCVVAVAACIEAVANKLVFQQTTAHPDYRDRRRPLQKINESATAVAQAAGITFIPLAAGQPSYEALETVRQLRNAFMHAKEQDEEVDPVALTSTAFSAVDEPHCRTYLQQLKLGVAHVYGQLPALTSPIVTRDNVKWLGDLEVP